MSQQLTTQVRASEGITFVVVAFAVEQIAQGAIQRLWTSWDSLDGLDIASVVLLAVTLVFTAVRFYHGNAAYLSRRYATWHHRQLAEGGVIAIPLAHTADTLAHLFQYLCLVAAGYFIGIDPTMVHAGYALVALFVIDTGWAIWAIPSSRSGGQQGAQIASAGPLVKWAATNAATASLLAVVLLHVDSKPLTDAGAQWAPIFILAVMVVNTVVDYKLNYDHYFEHVIAPEWVSATQANQSMQQLLQCIELNSTLGSPPSEKPKRDWLSEKLQLLFTFMLLKRVRAELFQRTHGNMHVGVYFERNGTLYPAFRWAPNFKLHNREFVLGSSFVGAAYTALITRPESVQIYDSYKDGRVDTSNALSTDREYYKSSVMANIFWPPGAKEPKAVGVLVVTSDEEAYFTRTVHEPLVLGFALEVATILSKAYPTSASRDELTALLHDEFRSGPVVINQAHR